MKCDICWPGADSFLSRLSRFRPDLRGFQSAKAGADRTKIRVGRNQHGGGTERIGTESEEALVEPEKLGVESAELHVGSDP